MMVDIRNIIAQAIDDIQTEIDNEETFPKRMLLRAKSKTLFTALIKLNQIQDKIINL